MYKNIITCSIILFSAANFTFADTFLWQGNNRNSVNTPAAWFNETTGAIAAVQPSATDTVKMDFQNSTTESGAPYARQIITFLGSDITWGDTTFKNINTNLPSTDMLDKFISQGTGRNISMRSLAYENGENPNYLWLGGGDSATPANISILNSVQMGSVSDTSAMKGVLVFGGNSNVGAGSSGGAIGPCQKVEIGGNTVLYGNSTLGFNTNLSGTSSAPSVSIGGVIRMNALNGMSPTLWLTNRTYSGTSGVNTYVKARGIDGSGAVKNNLTSGFADFNTTLELATQAGDNFKFDGTMNLDATSSNKLNVVKSGEGKQILVLRNNDVALTASSVSVEGGNLELCNGGSAFRSLALNSGKFGAASADGGTGGIAKFSTGTFDGGILSVDIFSASSCDVVAFSNSLNVAAITIVELELENFTGNGGIYVYSIIETPAITGIDPANIDDYFTAVDSHGNVIESASFSYADSKIYLTVNVPEPSIYAATFCVLALGFAVWRKRK